MAESLIFGTHEPNTLAQLADVASRAERSVLCADGHLGYIMPVGAVCAYRNQASVVGVGFDIACGNAAIRTDLRADRFDRRALQELATEIQRSTSFAAGRNNQSDNPPLHDPLSEAPA